MADTVIREVAKDVWTFSKPFSRFGIWPIGGRSTAVRLRDGGVWVLASTPLNEPTKAKIDELGPVRYIIGADAVHHLYLAEFKRAYPDAKLVAVQEAIEKKGKDNLTFFGAWGKDEPDTKYGFEDDIQHCYFSGFLNRDVAFFHPASKSLIQADLLFNLPPKEQYSKSSSSSYLPVLGSLTPYSWLHRRSLWRLGVDKDAMRRDARTVAGWDFERIIPCHGDVVEKDAKKAWETLYADYLN